VSKANEYMHTTTQTFRAKIYGKVFTIEERYHGNQVISYYNVDTKASIEYNKFWDLEPEIIKEK
jgi:hypothetical protein